MCWKHTILGFRLKLCQWLICTVLHLLDDKQESCITRWNDAAESLLADWDAASGRCTDKGTWNVGYNNILTVGGLILYYNNRSTQKTGSRQQNAWFHTKSPVGHKNARFDTKMPYSACISRHCHYQTFYPFNWNNFLTFAFKEPKHKLIKYHCQTVKQRTPLWPGFHNALNKNFVIRVNNHR